MTCKTTGNIYFQQAPPTRLMYEKLHLQWFGKRKIRIFAVDAYTNCCSPTGSSMLNLFGDHA